MFVLFNLKNWNIMLVWTYQNIELKCSLVKVYKMKPKRGWFGLDIVNQTLKR
ncbi:hypothetical protein SAMN04487943_103202 [Gracilibacillus orientalis]|uniref:Uncharacterized protein n=1 Tax=Gracilibacillus orientalis TaxID=334253 RepID=A0A1I4JVM8_9BACI|nr:hypothetical protein SAMN04487943_103202 [Gracilibacillus orientalis]